MAHNLTTRVCRALKGSTLSVAVDGRGMALSEMSLRERIQARFSWRCWRAGNCTDTGSVEPSAERMGGEREKEGGDIKMKVGERLSLLSLNTRTLKS